ncbi:MAG: hypothetical protein V4760_08695 [Bdellovibrionota bacterium]
MFSIPEAPNETTTEVKPRSFTLLASLFIAVITACSSSTSGQPSAPPAPPVRTRADGVVCSSVVLSKRPLSYCFQDRENQSSKPEPNVIYYFHGLGGNEEEIFGRLAFLLDAFSQLFGVDMPVVVGVSLGSSGVMGHEAADIVSRGIPQIEKTFAPGKPVQRLLLGASMGGHNVLRLGGESASSFVGAAGLCPAMGTFNGHDVAAVAAYKRRHAQNLDLDFFNRALAVYKKELPTAKAWADNNPFTLLPRGAYDGLPIFLSVGTEDSLGFYEGVREFTKLSVLRPGMSIQSPEVPGGHCAFDVDALLAFAVRSFQSRASSP